MADVPERPVALLAETVDLLDERAATEDQLDGQLEDVGALPWIDALALTLAAGVRVGARHLDRLPSMPANDESVDGAEGDDDVLTVDEVAALLKVGRNSVYESVGRNEVPHRRIGKQIRFSRRGIMRWLDSWSSQGAKEGT
jgi:excisionase family DNA binding protein